MSNVYEFLPRKNESAFDAERRAQENVVQYSSAYAALRLSIIDDGLSADDFEAIEAEHGRCTLTLVTAVQLLNRQHNLSS